MADKKYVTLEKEAFEKMCGLIRESYSVADAIDDDSVASNSAYSSQKIEELLSDIDAETVNGHTVESDVPSDAVFTDTVYDDTAVTNRVSVIEEDYLTSTDKTEISKELKEYTDTSISSGNFVQQNALGSYFANTTNSLVSNKIKRLILSTSLVRDTIIAGTSIDFYSLLSSNVSDFLYLLGASFIGFNTGSGPGGASTNKNFIVGNYYISEDNYALFKGNGEYGAKWIETFEIKNTNLSTASYSNQSYNLFFEVYYIAS